MLSDEEAGEIRQKLLSHIESNFPIEQRERAKQQLESMNSEQLESFLRRNKLIKEENTEETGEECVFCSIVSDRIKSIKIGENKYAIAVLEINPISKGHSIVIPRKHSNKTSKSSMNLAKKMAKNIKEKLSPRAVEIANSRLFGHEIINVLPVYNKENFNSERKPVRIEELEKVREELEKRKQSKRKKSKIEEFRSSWLPKRIP